MPLAGPGGKLEEKLAARDQQLAALVARVNEVEHKLALSTKQIVGPNSERTPTPEQEAKKREGHVPARGGNTSPDKRKQNAETKAALPTAIVPHPIPPSERQCPHCGDEVAPSSGGERSVEFEWIPGRFVPRLHVVETGRCPCTMHYAPGPAPRRVQEGCTYGPGFLAKLAVDKCADATPISHREGHAPLRHSAVAKHRDRPDVHDGRRLQASVGGRARGGARRRAGASGRDELPDPGARRAFLRVWTFLSKDLTVYVFSSSRSGDTPKAVLGGTTGSLTIDGYTGYNNVTEVDGRDRTGCWCHARRYLFDALPTAPQARDGLDIILELFLVERKAKSMNIVGAREHLELAAAAARRSSIASAHGANARRRTSSRRARWASRSAT